MSTLEASDAPKRPRVLIIEDEPTIADLLRTGLNYEDFPAVVATDGRAGLRLAMESHVDLIILDLMLPDIDGIQVCTRLRDAGRNVPIIMLTARKDIPERIAGLDAGADDYITKPFSFEELLARVRAVLRRHGHLQAAAVVSAAGIVLNAETREVSRNATPVELTRREFALLECVMRHPRRVFTRETLLNRVWGYEHAIDAAVVDVHISHLRDKLGDVEKRLIRTVYGVGYSFRPDSGHAED